MRIGDLCSLPHRSRFSALWRLLEACGPVTPNEHVRRRRKPTPVNLRQGRGSWGAVATGPKGRDRIAQDEALGFMREMTGALTARDNRAIGRVAHLLFNALRFSRSPPPPVDLSKLRSGRRRRVARSPSSPPLTLQTNSATRAGDSVAAPRSTRSTPWLGPGLVRPGPIRAPFPDVPVQVMEAPGTGRERAHVPRPAFALCFDTNHSGKYSTRFTRSSGSAMRAISSRSATMRPIVRSS